MKTRMTTTAANTITTAKHSQRARAAATAARLLGALLVLWLVEPGEAHAYLDPGTGSAVIQMVVAVAMGSLFVIKTYWRKIVSMFNGSASENDANDSASGEEKD